MLRRTAAGLRTTCSCQSSAISRMAPRYNTILPATSTLPSSSQLFSTTSTTAIASRYPRSISARYNSVPSVSSRPRIGHLDIDHGHLATGWALDVVQRRSFRTSARREMTATSLAFGAAALLKSSTAIACLAGFSRLVYTILPFAAFKTIRLKFKRKWHAAHFARLQTPPHIAAFYESELAMENPIEPDCRTFHELDTPMVKEMTKHGKGWHTACWTKKLKKNLGMEAQTVKMGTWPPWGEEVAAGTSKRAEEPSNGTPPVVEFTTKASKAQFFNEVITWTWNISRERTGLSKTDKEADISGSLWKRWTMFYLPKPSPEVMAKIMEMPVADREKLYELRRWFAKEKLYTNHISRHLWVFWTMIWLPVIMFVIVAAFSLERVPFTGRFRLIMLSPEEEETLTDKLRGSGWYKTVLSMFTTAESPAPPVVPMEDWRWNWVNSVLRRLERGLEEHCRAEKEGRQMIDPAFMAVDHFPGGKDLLPPPPPAHPLHPRARVSTVLHSALEGKDTDRHLAVGPPYALLLLDNEERNAMSYGFGEGGSGGVVVYTGILDEILNSYDASKIEIADSSEPVMQAMPTRPTGLWQSLFGGPSLAPPPPTRLTPTRRPEPTEEQTLQLALVLSHELSHLVLSHHLESLSWSEIVIPGATGLGSDLIRTIFYPITFFLGPFVNDAISDITKKKAEETTAYSDICFSVKQEREADVVSLRLLAYAGFDPNAAVKYWSDVPQPACTKSAVEHLPFQFLRGTVHDERQLRLERLLEELERWKEYALRKRPTE